MEVKIQEITHQEELLRCATSFDYFCKYVKILNEKGLIPFDLFPFQKRLVEEIEENRNVIFTKFRCGGFTTTASIYMVWRSVFFPGERMLYAANYDREALYAGRIVRSAIDNLPDWLKPKLSVCNDHHMSFSSGGDIWFLKLEAMKGRIFDLLILDEPAFVPHMDSHWRELYPIVTLGRCVAFSTPNGASGWFYDTYRNASENGFHVYKCDYAEYPGRDAGWADTVRGNLGEKGWRMEFLQEFV